MLADLVSSPTFTLVNEYKTYRRRYYYIILISIELKNKRRCLTLELRSTWSGEIHIALWNGLNLLGIFFLKEL